MFTTIIELAPVQAGILVLGVSAVLFTVAKSRKRSGRSARVPEAAAVLLAGGALLVIALSMAARGLPHLTWA